MGTRATESGNQEPLVGNNSDTALWSAVLRGWENAQSLMHAAARVNRLPLWMRPFALLPDRFPKQGKVRGGGLCLLVRENAQVKNELPV